MTIIFDGTNGITYPSNTIQSTAYQTRFKNRIINGNMTIDQRNAGASVTPTAGNYLVDRWQVNMSQASKFTAQQNAGSVTPPAGFINYLGLTSSSSYSSTSSDYFQLKQPIEGLNIADLGWGTANAQTVTLSFWVRSSLTGQFGGAIRNNPTYSYTYPFSYTISSANTWTQISVTVVGPNASQGTWNTNTSAGLEVLFDLGCGSTLLSTGGSWQSGAYAGVTGDVKLVGTSGATFYITGVQLEVGSAASAFEYVNYTDQLLMCQRYYFAYANSGVDFQEIATRTATTGGDLNVISPVKMRTTPTLYAPSSSSNYGRIVFYDTLFNVTTSTVSSFAVSGDQPSNTSIHINYSTGSISGTYVFASFDTIGGATAIGFSAEL
jgi:hypothetical protein